MQANWKAILAVATLALGGVLGMGGSLAQAQAVGGAAGGANSGYYYSPGGYSGGTYFSPGYYPSQGTASPRVGTSPSSRSGSVSGRTRSSAVNYYDPTTGRNNLAIPLAKPWLRPLR
jgi:hypothetical protein